MAVAYIVTNLRGDIDNISRCSIDELVFINYLEYESYKGKIKKFLLDNIISENPCKVENKSKFNYEIGSIASAENYILSIKIDHLISFAETIKLAAKINNWNKIYVNIDANGLIARLLYLSHLNVEILPTKSVVSDLILLDEGYYSTRRNLIVRTERKFSISYEMKLRIASGLIINLINWLGLKKILFSLLWKNKSSLLILFNRYTSRSSRALPSGKIVLCSRYWPKSFRLIIQAFIRLNCIVDIFVDESENQFKLTWNKFLEKAYLELENPSIGNLNQVEISLRNIAKNLAPVIKNYEVLYLLKKYGVSDVISPFDSYYPVIRLLDQCLLHGARRNIIQHGIMGYPLKDFLFCDKAYLFSIKLSRFLLEKGLNKNQIVHISNDLDYDTDIISEDNYYEIMQVRKIYIVTSVRPVFSSVPMRTATMELTYEEFCKDFSKLVSLKISLTVVCHPAENADVYKLINLKYNLSYCDVVIGFDSIRNIEKNAVFIDLGYSTISSELILAGATVLKYFPFLSESKPPKVQPKNCQTYYDMKQMCLDIQNEIFYFKRKNIANRSIINSFSNNKIEIWVSKFKSKFIKVKLNYKQYRI